MKRDPKDVFYNPNDEEEPKIPPRDPSKDAWIQHITSLGGKAAAKKLGSEGCKIRAQKAIKARWDKVKAKKLEDQVKENT